MADAVVCQVESDDGETESTQLKPTNSRTDLNINVIHRPHRVDETHPFNERYPYTYYIPHTSNNLIISIIIWICSTIICAMLFILLSPLLLVIYIIMSIQLQINVLKLRRRADLCIPNIYSVVAKLLDVTFNTILLIISVFVLPVYYVVSMTINSNDTSAALLIPLILFLIFRKSVLVRMARWYLRKIPKKSLPEVAPQWFLKYFIQSGLCLHHILIKDYRPAEVYLSLQSKLNGVLTANNTEFPMITFIIDLIWTRNFYDMELFLFRSFVVLVIALQLVLPFTVIDSDNVLLDTVLLVCVVWMMSAIWFEVEGRFIFSLLTYLDRMRQMGQLLYFDASLKKVLKWEKKKWYNWKGGQAYISKRKRMAKAMNYRKVIKLSDGNNANVFIENWFMMYTEANLYSKRFEHIIYSLVVAVIMAVAFAIYNFVLIKEEELNTKIIISAVGCLAVILIWIELLIISFKFSKLEKRHIVLLTNHKIWIKQTMFEMVCDNNTKNQKEMERLRGCCELIDDLLKKVKINGMSPKIAGVPMNDAFVRITWSMVISLITAGISYYVRGTYRD
eukprot:442230_1